MKLISNLILNIKYSIKSSIRTKINVLIFAILLISIITITFTFNTIYSNTVIKQTSNNSIQKIHLISNNIDLLTQSIENYSRMIITSSQTQKIIYSDINKNNIIEHLNNINILKGTFSNLIERNNIINSIFILNLKNSYIYDIGSNGRELDYNSFATQANIKKLVDPEQHFLWTDIYKSQFNVSNSTVNILTLYEPIMNMRTGTIDGIIAININESAISSILSKTKLGTSGNFFLINNEGIIISSANPSTLFTNISNQNYLKQCKDTTQQAKIFNINGVNNLVVTYSLEKLNWKIIGVVPIKELLPHKIIINIYIFIISIILFLLGLSVSFFFSKRITTPIINLSNLMKQTGDYGNLELRIDEENYCDEAGLLLKSYNSMMVKISELMKSVKEEQKIKRKYELSMINAQIKPHFLYNTLNSICGLMCIEKYDTSFNMIKSLGQFYKLSLNNGSGLIQIKDEIRLIESYVNIQKHKYENSLTFKKNIEPQILNYYIPKLTLQPLIENSFKHGFIGMKDLQPIILIEGTQNGNYMDLTVSDNGKGNDKNFINNHFLKSNHASNNFGLNSICTLLTLYFLDDFKISAETSPGKGMKIFIHIPLRKE